MSASQNYFGNNFLRWHSPEGVRVLGFSIPCGSEVKPNSGNQGVSKVPLDCE